MKRCHKLRACRRLSGERCHQPSTPRNRDGPPVCLDLDEFEAMRLCDYEEKSQIQAAGEMEISRATVQRLLASGRRKVVSALLHEQAIIVRNDTDFVRLKGEIDMEKRKKKELRIALPTTDQKTVDEHFGHCTGFAVFDVGGTENLSMEFLNAPPHAPGVLPAFLAELNVDVIITGGMGQRAISLFAEAGIEVILGASGGIEENLREYLGGEMVSQGSPCRHTEEKGACHS